jgi:hypothetical protein
MWLFDVLWQATGTALAGIDCNAATAASATIALILDLKVIITDSIQRLPSYEAISVPVRINIDLIDVFPQRGWRL